MNTDSTLDVALNIYDVGFVFFFKTYLINLSTVFYDMLEL